MINSAIRTKATIVVEMNINTCAEYSPQIKIKHITKVIIDDANKHIDTYLNIHRSYLIKIDVCLLDEDKADKTYDISHVSKIVC